MTKYPNFFWHCFVSWKKFGDFVIHIFVTFSEYINYKGVEMYNDSRSILKIILRSRQTFFGKIRSPIFNHQLFWYYFSFGPSVSPTVKMQDEYLMGLNNLELVFNMPPDSYRIIGLKSLWSRSQTFQIILNFFKLV